LHLGPKAAVHPCPWPRSWGSPAERSNARLRPTHRRGIPSRPHGLRHHRRGPSLRTRSPPRRAAGRRHATPLRPADRGTPDVHELPGVRRGCDHCERGVGPPPPASIHGYGDPRGRVETAPGVWPSIFGRGRAGVRGRPGSDRRRIRVRTSVGAVLTTVSHRHRHRHRQRHRHPLAALPAPAAIAMEDPSFAFPPGTSSRHHGGRCCAAFRSTVAGATYGPVCRTGHSGTYGRSSSRPAHQYPMGVTMQPDRRHAATTWAAARPGAFVIEDDYDGEFRYDRPTGRRSPRAPRPTASSTFGTGVPRRSRRGSGSPGFVLPGLAGRAGSWKRSVTPTCFNRVDRATYAWPI